MLGIGAPPQTPRGIRLQEAAKIPSVGIVGVIFPSSPPMTEPLFGWES